MNTDASVSIDAPPSLVWNVFVDVSAWPDWTESVTRIVALDGPDLVVGNRFEIKQPKFPKLVWTVSEVAPGSSWTWQQRSFGGTTSATHEVVELDTGRTLVRQRLTQLGPIGTLVGKFTRKLTATYLEMEGEGLKTVCEQRHHDAPAS